MVDDPQRPARRSRRRQAIRAQGAPAASKAPAASDAAAPSRPADAVVGQPPEPPRRKRPPRDSGERGLRDLVGAGQSQVGVSGALRARDLNRPTEEDLDEAERDLVIVRRNWRPDGADA
jgi:hypothetical protein